MYIYNNSDLINIAANILLTTIILVMATLEDTVGKTALVATGDGRIIVGKFFVDKKIQFSFYRYII